MFAILTGSNAVNSRLSLSKDPFIKFNIIRGCLLKTHTLFLFWNLFTSLNPYLSHQLSLSQFLLTLVL